MIFAVGCGVVTARLTRRDGSVSLSGGERWAVLFGAFIGAALFAKLPWLISDAEGFRDGSVWFTDGRTITFGMVGAYLGVELAKLAAGIQKKTGDALAVPAAVSIAVGRVGCFVAPCCFGIETSVPWAVDFGDGLHRHPTQLYEAAFHACAAVVLYRLRAQGRFPRNLIKVYFIAYFVFRFTTEFIRPEPRLWLGITLFQWASLAFIPLFAFLFVRDRSLPDPSV